MGCIGEEQEAEGEGEEGGAVRRRCESDRTSRPRDGRRTISEATRRTQFAWATTREDTVHAL